MGSEPCPYDDCHDYGACGLCERDAVAKALAKTAEFAMDRADALKTQLAETEADRHRYAVEFVDVCRERDTLQAQLAECQDDVARLRKRTHELQEQADATAGPLLRQLNDWKQTLAWADDVFKEPNVAYQSAFVRAKAAEILGQLADANQKLATRDAVIEVVRKVHEGDHWSRDLCEICNALARLDAERAVQTEVTADVRHD